jgi:hypothetical protein
LVVVVVVLVAVLLIGGVLTFVFLSTPRLPVEIGSIEFYAPDNVCGLNTNPVGTSGYNDTTSANTTIDFLVPNYNATSCEIKGISTNTTGFTLYDPQIPRTILGTSSAEFNVTIKTPPSKFAGNLNLILR